MWYNAQDLEYAHDKTVHDSEKSFGSHGGDGRFVRGVRHFRAEFSRVDDGELWRIRVCLR